MKPSCGFVPSKKRLSRDGFIKRGVDHPRFPEGTGRNDGLFSGSPGWCTLKMTVKKSWRVPLMSERPSRFTCVHMLAIVSPKYFLGLILGKYWVLCPQLVQMQARACVWWSWKQVLSSLGSLLSLIQSKARAKYFRKLLLWWTHLCFLPDWRPYLVCNNSQGNSGHVAKSAAAGKHRMERVELIGDEYN